ncbi:hypothetical protein [Streptomyces sp. NPDC008240]|uniref:hypothetical protein n=1 Tax=Streptomyces sp. NPDC008240 TaxID=3364822 RepID=UPI0036EFD04D
MSEPPRIPAPDGVAPAAQYSHGLQDVVELTCFVTDIAFLPAIPPQALNCVRAGETPMARAAHIPGDRLPAASAVQVAPLVAPEFLMEVEALVVAGG